jgi:N-acylneuraminate cytidylyltransferase
MWRLDGAWLTPFVPENVYGVAEAYNEPRQRLPRAFVQNGAVDAIRTNVITDRNSMSGTRMKAFLMDEAESINIDSLLDWELAEILIRGRSVAVGIGSSR